MMTMTVYTQPVCPKCRVLKKMLSERGIEFVEKTDLKKVVDHGFTATPVLELVDGTMMDFTQSVKHIKGLRG